MVNNQLTNEDEGVNLFKSFIKGNYFENWLEKF